MTRDTRRERRQRGEAGCPWWPWPLYALDLIPGYIVGFGPFLATLVVAIANGPEHLSRTRAKQTPTPPEGARPTPRVA